MRIREGNDFTLNWEIERGGIAENIQSAISRRLLLKRHREVREIEKTSKCILHTLNIST